MATNTPNFNLVKPDLTDFADIRVLNSNMDIIDTELKKLSNIGEIDLSGYALKSDLNKYLPLTGGNIVGDLTVQNKSVVTVVDSFYNTDKSQYWIKYSDGTLVQHFKVDGTTNGLHLQQITLLTPFIDTNYFVGICAETKLKRVPMDNTGFSSSIVGATHTTQPVKSTTGFMCVFDTEMDIVYHCVGRWE